MTEYVDWTKVPIDTEIYVKDEDEPKWFKRYFAGYDEETGKVKAFLDGNTSQDESDFCYWDYATLSLYEVYEKTNKDEEHEEMNDVVNHPSHYTSGKIEVIDYIEDQKLPYHLGNVVKYISRAGKKDPAKTIEDLKKAEWYLHRYINLLENNEGEQK